MIKILSVQQLREADQFTIKHESITSIDLMERAATAALLELYKIIGAGEFYSWYFFCGYGNNGGDGLAMARMISEEANAVQVFYLADKSDYSEDFKINLHRLKTKSNIKIHEIGSTKDFPSIEPNTLIIDALFGSGINKPLSGVAADLVDYLNQQDALRIAIDIPSGLFAEKFSEGKTFHAHHTITFQSPKLSFLFPENFNSAGDWHVMDIGLDKNFIASLHAESFLLQKEDVQQRIIVRKKFDHKGKFGHAFIHAGNTGKMGAAILCAKSCLKTGAGLTTAHVPVHQSLSLNIAIPEAMTSEYSNRSSTDLMKYSAFALGPGIGTDESAREIFFSLLKEIHSTVILDADALTLLSREKDYWKLIPENSILTPHPREFERLAGLTSNWQERHNRQLELSNKHSVFLVLKGAYTCITTPDGNSYFNSTGNPGMAKGGSGDVLTGMLVSLLAQGYSPEDACIMGVYLHGLAADLAVENENHYSLLATDIINNIGDAFNQIQERDTGSPDMDLDADDFDDDFMRNN